MRSDIAGRSNTGEHVNKGSPKELPHRITEDRRDGRPDPDRRQARGLRLQVRPDHPDRDDPGRRPPEDGDASDGSP